MAHSPQQPGVDPELSGRAALVTASSEGLGFACALRLVEAGCRVAICARRPGVLERARAEIERRTGMAVRAIPADLTRPEQIDALVTQARAHFGRLDILVANPGAHIPYGGLDDLTEDHWYQAFEMLLMSAVRLSKAVVPIMRAQNLGDIVFLTSSTVKEPPAHLLLSNAFQAGVTGLAKTLARSLAPHGIRVNVVAPGYFDTGRVRRQIDEIVKRQGGPRDRAALEVAGDDIPLGRIGRAEELAELVAFVLSRRAAFLTGTTIQIDGGSNRFVF
jgi:3-oxoacyl-[acyl-carrier protein] reductase